MRYVTNYGEPIEGINNKVLVTNNYTGDPSTTTWTDITGTLTEGRDWETWENYSAAIPTELIGKSNVVIALYYSCETSSGTWEVKNLTVKEGNEQGGGDEPGGGEVSGNSVIVKANGFGLGNDTGLSTLTLVDGTTLTFAKNDGYNAPKFYTAGSGSFRMYPSNTLTINSTKTIESVDVTCDEYNGTIYNASGDISTSAGTINVDGAAVTVTGVSANNLTLTNTSTTTGAPSQIRIVELIINYAE